MLYNAGGKFCKLFEQACRQAAMLTQDNNNLFQERYPRLGRQNVMTTVKSLQILKASSRPVLQYSSLCLTA